ncbi:Secretion-regulating guanine nucleotide exchange factor [Pseudolycoriella hygida]|uniref:Secretion-regulating guanine nucleotide exchange factor n=1 Tax=Pseudolycoriella hygida TaxID=35572 RepID=A0A9Q0RZN0_9DIPT|nr:Secretion-regulating guanine nucleotide exchange factor [Pseudolycoriella hygida]
MSEIKRVQLADAPDDQTASSTKNVSASKSIRFDFELFEPTADSFPEFNYSKLLYEEKKKQKKSVKKVNGFSDPFEENFDGAFWAKELERKYGTASGGKKRGSNNNDCDKGAGYDLNDGFIDNSEAVCYDSQCFISPTYLIALQYDELIPDEIETDRGGFYINSGALEFKNLPNYERPEDAARMPKPKKRLLSTSSESSSSGNEEPNKKPLSNKNGPNEKKPKLSEKDKHKNKEKKLKVKERKDDAPGYDSDKETSKKVVKTTTVKDMLRAKRDSMRNMIDNGNKSEQTEDSNKDSSSSESSDSSEDGSDGEKKDSGCVENGDIKLPDNLSPELLANIKKITEASKLSSSGKTNFFDSTINNLLFEIDTAARLKGGVARNQIYNYLEKYLPCTKQTILTRVKKIRSQKEDAKTNKIVKKLKMAVGNVMPNLLSNYEKECERVNELKASNVSVNGGKSEQTIKNPKKKFLWTDTTRNILCDIINSRKQSFAVIKPRRETIEDFVNSYLKAHVLKIWPDGWMKIEELLRELEKRQLNNVKKSKESKKMLESSSQQPLPDVKHSIGEATTTTLSNTTSNSNVAASHSSLISEVKSVLSSNNSIVPILKETSVTVVPSLQTEDMKTSVIETSKTTTSPTPSFGSNLTITPIGANDKMTAKPLASVQNQVTITNVESLSQPSKVLTTSPAITQHTSKTTIKDQPIMKSSSSSSSTTGQIINQNVSKSSTRTPPLPSDMISPPKKATDHSINSIISSTAPTASHSKSESVKLVDASSSGGTTRVINLDNLSTNEILNTAAASSESHIRIKSVETLNKSVHKNPTEVSNPTKPPNSMKDKDITIKKPHSASSSQAATNIRKNSPITVPKSSMPLDSIIKSTGIPNTASKSSHSLNQKSNFVAAKTNATVPHIQKPATDKAANALLNPLVEEISSDSDEVEFVSETHLKKMKNPTSHVIKNIKTSNSSSRSSSPNNAAQSGLLKRRRDSSIDGKEELDVKQIMKAIKELQEMQTNATGVHSSGSNSSHNKKSLHHSSSLPYNKKLDHLEHTNSHGQLGLGFESEMCTTPMKVSTSIKLNELEKLRGGGGHLIGLDKRGKLYGCGWNNKGQLGLNSTEDVHTISALPDLETQFIDVACGWDSTAAIDRNGILYVWGSNAFDQLGFSSKKAASHFKTPVILTLPCEEKVVQVCFGLRFMCILCENRTIYVVGRWKFPKDCQTIIQNHVNYYKLNTSHLNVSQIACGSNHLVCLSESNCVVGFGDNKFSQCETQTIKTESIKCLRSGWSHNGFLTESGHVYLWGRNSYGQLANEFPEKSAELIKLTIGDKIKEFHLGSEHGLIVTEKKIAYTWGWNEHGNCGNGNETNVLKPHEVVIPGKCSLTATGSGFCFKKQIFAFSKMGQVNLDDTFLSDTLDDSLLKYSDSDFNITVTDNKPTFRCSTPIDGDDKENNSFGSLCDVTVIENEDLVDLRKAMQSVDVKSDGDEKKETTEI